MTNFKTFSNKELDDIIAYRTKNGDPYPENYLEIVRREIRRRDKKRKVK